MGNLAGLYNNGETISLAISMYTKIDVCNVVRIVAQPIFVYFLYIFAIRFCAIMLHNEI